RIVDVAEQVAAELSVERHAFAVLLVDRVRQTDRDAAELIQCSVEHAVAETQQSAELTAGDRVRDVLSLRSARRRDRDLTRGGRLKGWRWVGEHEGVSGGDEDPEIAVALLHDLHVDQLRKLTQQLVALVEQIVWLHARRTAVRGRDPVVQLPDALRQLIDLQR